MYFQETYTFKMRRKEQMFTFSLLLFTFISGILAAHHQVCPEHCECYVDLQYEYNWHTAACDHLVWNRTYFPAIVQLKLNRAPYADQCHLPNITAKMFPNLQRLEMSNCSLTGIPSAGINDFKSLHTLDMSYNLIRSIPSNALDSYQHVQHLTLANNPLNPHSPPAIVSSSLYEISLDSCNIQTLPANTFNGTPNLKFLFVSNNNISLLQPQTFPEGLSTIDLSKNKITNVPTNEFLRLSNLAQINLSGNPVNCTCKLVQAQDWLSGKAVIFVDGISCAYPRKYSGRNLSHIPESDLCNYGKFEDASSSREKCGPNQICNSGATVGDDGYVNDQEKDENEMALKQDEVIPVDSSSLIKEDTNQLEQLDGSGDGDSTEIPIAISKTVPSTSPSTTTSTSETSPTPSVETSTTSSSETSPTSSAETTISSTEGVVKVEQELSSTPETTSAEISSTQNASSETSEVPTTISSESPAPSSTLSETTPVSSEKETTLASENNVSQLPGRLQHDSAHKEMYGYLIPGLAVLLIGLVCLAVYCSQCASKVDTYKQTDANVEGAELQEVSLLPDNNHATIVKHSSKYPGEKENGQTERLMSDHEQTNGGNSIVAEVNGNGSQHSDETIECCKLANGQSAANQNALGNVECTVVRVTTLPDSIPKTAVIRDL